MTVDVVRQQKIRYLNLPNACFTCKAQDHLIRDCPHWRPSPNASQGANAAASTAPAIKDIGSSVGSGQTAKEGGPLAHPSQSVGGRSFGAVVQESPRSTVLGVPSCSPFGIPSLDNLLRAARSKSFVPSYSAGASVQTQGMDVYCGWQVKSNKRKEASSPTHLDKQSSASRSSGEVIQISCGPFS